MKDINDIMTAEMAERIINKKYFAGYVKQADNTPKRRQHVPVEYDTPSKNTRNFIYSLEYLIAVLEERTSNVVTDKFQTTIYELLDTLYDCSKYCEEYTKETLIKSNVNIDKMSYSDRIDECVKRGYMPEMDTLIKLFLLETCRCESSKIWSSILCDMRGILRWKICGLNVLKNHIHSNITEPKSWYRIPEGYRPHVCEIDVKDLIPIGELVGVMDDITSGIEMGKFKINDDLYKNSKERLTELYNSYNKGIGIFHKLTGCYIIEDLGRENSIIPRELNDKEIHFLSTLEYMISDNSTQEERAEYIFSDIGQLSFKCMKLILFIREKIAGC